MAAAKAAHGQACEAGTRLLVPKRLEHEFIAQLLERAKTLTLGDPLDPATDVGPVITKA